MKSQSLQKKRREFDISIVCFALVLAAAIPVAWLRTKTYSLGYELGKLKTIEQDLRHENAILEMEIYEQQKSIRSDLSESEAGLEFPQPSRVIHVSRK